MASGAHNPVAPRLMLAARQEEAEKPSVPCRKKLGGVAIAASRFVRQALGMATLSVPLSYFVQFGIGGGLFRHELFEAAGIGHYMRFVVTPGMAAGNALFAARMVYNGWNFLYVVVGVTALVVRHYVMTPFHRLELWTKARFAPPVPKKKLPLGAPIQLSKSRTLSVSD